MEAGAAVLPRSVTSFRRQGSSGTVWDDRLTQKFNKGKPSSEPRPVHSQSTGKIAYRRVKVSSEPEMDPPSPKLSACGFCSIFGKPNPSQRKSRKP